MVPLSEDQPLHAERIRCSFWAGECAAMGPVVRLVEEPDPVAVRVTGRG